MLPGKVFASLSRYVRLPPCVRMSDAGMGKANINKLVVSQALPRLKKVPRAKNIKKFIFVIFWQKDSKISTRQLLHNILQFGVWGQDSFYN